MVFDTRPNVASVLVIAADPVIETLVGELVAFSGYRPVFDAAAGAAGEAIRRDRPDVVLLDTSMERPVVRACLLAAEEVGTRPILMSSNSTATELAAQADARNIPFFVLPGGPKPLGALIERTVGATARPPVVTISEPRDRGTVRPAICAALASVGRARAMVLHAQFAVAEDRVLREEMIEEDLAARHSRAALRAAVVDYARQLRAADVAEEKGIAIVASALQDCATVVGAEDTVVTLLDESADWAREAYRSA